MSVLTVISIFESIDGEVNGFHQGALTTFIRLSHCNLRCKWCDSTYSFEGGDVVSVENIVNIVKNLKPKKVTLTGGEPLLQPEGVLELLTELTKLGYSISVETNGTLPVLLKSYNISWIYDYKLPSSGMESQMKFDNFATLESTDWVKFVIADDADFNRAIEIRKYLDGIGCLANYAYSPVPGFSTDTLVNRLLSKGKGDEIVSLQIHKIVWPNCGAIEEH